MSKRTGAGVNVGGSSILLIFVLLCLTTFATLSMVSANADLKLTNKNTESVTQYYEADAQAQERLAQVAQRLGAVPAGDGGEAYLAACAGAVSGIEGIETQRDGGLRIRWQEPMGESRALQVELEVTGEAYGGAPFRIASWRTVQTEDWVPQDSITLWGGTPGATEGSGAVGALPPGLE